MNPQVDKYLIDGCMRCKFGATPKCKVNFWRDEMVMLRHIVLESGLTEEIKWGVPVYTYHGKNVVTVSALKEFAVIGFFKGVLLTDEHHVLERQGNMQSDRLIRFTSTEAILTMEPVLKALINEAVDVEKSGKKVVFDKNPEPIPEELREVFLEDPELMKAFYSLTPGRQRGYILYFSQPKQQQTRLARIEKSREQILNGIGINDKNNSR